MTAVAGKTFGTIGALAAFPRRLAAREVERQRGQLQARRHAAHLASGVRPHAARQAPATPRSRRASTPSAKAGRRPLSENGFLRLLGLRQIAGSVGADAAVAARPVAAVAARLRSPVAVRRVRARRRALFLPRPDPVQEICRADRRRRRLGRDRPVDPPLRAGRLAHRAVAACRPRRRRSMRAAARA